MPAGEVGASKKQENPQIGQSPTVAPSVPFLYVKSPFSSKASSAQAAGVL